MPSDSSIMRVRRRVPAALISTLAAAVLTATVPAASVAPESSVGEADPVVARAVQHVAAETHGIDATLQALRDAGLVDTLIAAGSRGLHVRVIVPEVRYRDPANPWHAWNVDRLHAAGVQVRHLRQAGPPQEGLMVLHGQGMVVLGSFGATRPGAPPPAAFAQFATRAWMYAWAVERFTRLWHNGAGHEETVAFSPLPAGTPRLVAPDDGADEAASPAVLRWQPGPWAHRYDVYAGRSPEQLVPVVADAALDPGRDTGEAIGAPLSDLAADTTYYWRVVSRTMAGLEREGPIWSFRTSATAMPMGTSGRVATARLPESTEASLSTVVEPSVLETLIQRRSPQGGETGRAAVPRSADEPSDPGTFSPSVSAPPGGTAPSAPVPDEIPPPGAPANPDGGAAPGDAVSGDMGGGGPSSQEPAVDGYPGREPGAAWRQAALERIERIRKSDIELRVVDAEGRPIEGAEVRLEMTRHRFGFGSAVTAYDLTADTADGRRYRAHVERAFNKVVLENDLKWGPWTLSANPEPSALYDRERTFAALDWLTRRGIQVRGHYVVWGHLTGDGGTSQHARLDDAAFQAAVLRHGEEVVTTLGGRIAEWDVVNHPLGWGEGTMLDRFGEHFYDGVFTAAAAWDPRVRRYLNEGAVLPRGGYNRDAYFQLIGRMLARRAPIQGIGLMGHFFAEENLVHPEELLRVFDRYASFGLPLQVTEFDVRYGTEGERAALTAEQEELQADFTRDFLIAAFSHPAIEAVVLWGFWEKRHWFPNAGLYRDDWTIKPNGRSWEDLVLHAWWTRERGTTSADGMYRDRGFQGEYRVDIDYGGGSVSCHIVLGPAGVRGDIEVTRRTGVLDAPERSLPMCLR